jgi:hypothetical protein
LGQAIDVRGARLGIAAEVADPVVQVVDRDEEDIGPLGGSRCGRGDDWKADPDEGGDASNPGEWHGGRISEGELYLKARTAAWYA